MAVLGLNGNVLKNAQALSLVGVVLIARPTAIFGLPVSEHRRHLIFDDIHTSIVRSEVTDPSTIATPSQRLAAVRCASKFVTYKNAFKHILVWLC